MNARTERVFLDANVILSGAVNRFGPAGHLVRIPGRFVYSQYVLQEARQMIESAAPSKSLDRLEQNLANAWVDTYLHLIGAVMVDDVEAPAGLAMKDVWDELVYGSALAHADALCTYNTKHFVFPGSQLRCVTPHALVRRARGSLHWADFLQRMTLGMTKGTFLILGSVRWSDPFPILRDALGAEIWLGRDGGRVEVRGVSLVQKKRPYASVVRRRQNGAEELGMAIRYRKDVVEVFGCERAETGDWALGPLQAEANGWNPPVVPLVGGPNPEISACVEVLTGVANWLSDSKLTRAVSDGTLDAVYGSEDLRRALARIRGSVLL